MNEEKLGYKLRIEARKQGLNAFTFATLKDAKEESSETLLPGNDENGAK